MTRSDVGPAKVALADTGPEAVSCCSAASKRKAGLLVLDGHARAELLPLLTFVAAAPCAC